MVEKWGYKGSETSLNGLTMFMDKVNWKMKYNHKGTIQDKYSINLSNIIKYAELHLPNYTKYTDNLKTADLIAKHIDSNSLFKHFRDWYTDMLSK